MRRCETLISDWLCLSYRLFMKNQVVTIVIWHLIKWYYFKFASFFAAFWEVLRFIRVSCASNTTEKHITQVEKASRATNLPVVRTCTTATSPTEGGKNWGGGEARWGTDYWWRRDDTRWINRQMEKMDSNKHSSSTWAPRRARSRCHLTWRQKRNRRGKGWVGRGKG